MIRSVLFLLLAPVLCLAQTVPLEIKGGGVKVVQVDRVVVIKEDATVVQSFPVTITAPSGGGLYFWTYPAGVIGVDEGEVFRVSAAPKGACTIAVKTISPNLDKDGKFLGFKTTFYTTTFYVGEVAPPTPQPPDVKPTPPAPIPAAGLRALVVFESTPVSNDPKLTSKQTNELWGEEMALYTREKFAKDAAGVVEFRRFDRSNLDEFFPKLSPVWQEAIRSWKAAGSPCPGIVISNGVTGFSGPLPDGGILDLVKKYEK